MRREILTFGLAALLVLPGALSAVAAPIPIALEKPAAQADSTLRLEATAVSRARVGQAITVTASLTNTSSERFQFWLPTPCDPVFTASVFPADRPGLPVLEPEPSDMACITVIKQVTLEPGQKLEQELELKSKGLTPGKYTVTVTFHGRTESWGVHDLKVNLDLTVDGFSDMADHWASASVNAGVGAGFINGYPDGSFKPQAQVTRAELVAMLVRAKGLELSTEGRLGFTDTADHWVSVQGFLQAAISSKILDVNAIGSLLRPDQPLTREETAVLAVRALGYTEINARDLPLKLYFRDHEQISPGALPYIEIATEAGILTGYEDVTFRPNLPVTRAEAVTIVLRTMMAAEAKR